ncbi:MAG TPA: aminotransferase class V-fold PLP-dependent enzyme [Methylomusa anaerophila]|uniref:cysteine desulfurase n=1 Tax=Methylomusa anaerophila TaxID=1930071 RepID=A0A348AHP0_9FIRM|nr:aminotransferase class V-fold PLP-dependent enzyme [Methylomusa anaerophila]BBB90588.1 putative cysteine desulfurase [Methylomusa anaerophila]HML88805.1 aminotransferase class V-fold PLP-dependent enzyme [Methylomusa anaerophila]
MSALIYLDNAATTWPKPEEVYRAVDCCLRNIGANPGRGGHSMARAAGLLLYETREELAELFHIEDANQIAFTLNATDAINTAIFGVVRPGDTVVTTAMEHNAVARALRFVEKRGANLIIVPCSPTGDLDMKALTAALNNSPKAVVMTHASNVTGQIQPVEEIGRLTREHGITLIVDAAQTAGVEAIDVAAMGIDVLAFSGHKGLLGPQGTGGLYVREGIAVAPLRLGGTGSLSESDEQPDFMPDRLESGTPNTPGIAGLQAGVRFIRNEGSGAIRKKELELTQELENGLKEIPGLTIYSPLSKGRRTAVMAFTIDGQDCGDIAYRLDRDYGIACRSGLHCAPWAHRTIGTLKTGAVRFSPGYFNTPKQISEAVRAVGQLAAKRKG